MLLRSPQCRAVPTQCFSPHPSHVPSRTLRTGLSPLRLPRKVHVPSEGLCVLRPRRTSLISSFTLRTGLGPLTLPQEVRCPLRRPQTPDKGERFCLLREGVVPSLPLGADTHKRSISPQLPSGEDCVSVAHTVQLSFLSLPQNPSGCPMSPYTPSEQSSIPLRSQRSCSLRCPQSRACSPQALSAHALRGELCPLRHPQKVHVPSCAKREGLGLLRAHGAGLVTSLTLIRAAPLGPSRKVNVSSPTLRAGCVPSDSSGLGVRPNITFEQRSGLLGPPHSRIVSPQTPRAGSGLLTCPQRMAAPP